jgi:hypothetical protein
LRESRLTTGAIDSCRILIPVQEDKGGKVRRVMLSPQPSQFNIYIRTLRAENGASTVFRGYRPILVA